jgi:hypothetical protein
MSMNRSNSSLPEEEKKCRICFESQCSTKSFSSYSKGSKSLHIRKGLRSLKKPFLQSSCSLSSSSSVNELIYPCKCSGSVKYVHVKCLEKWREACYGTDGYLRCHQCKSPYEMQQSSLEKWLNLRTFCILLSSMIFVGHFMLVHLILYLSKVIPFWFGENSSRKVQLIHSAIVVAFIQLLFYSVHLFLVILLSFSWFRWMKILDMPLDKFERNMQVTIIGTIVLWALYQNLTFFATVSKRIAIPLYKSVPVSRKRTIIGCRNQDFSEMSKGK